MALTAVRRRLGARARTGVAVCALLSIAPLARAAVSTRPNVLFPPNAPLSAGGPVPLSAYAQMRWRLIGPFRGGWATMAAGVPSAPNTFYIGTAGGGVWKSVDAGRTWQSIGAHLPPAIGAIAVAPSAPRTIYVGTGQVAPRYDVAAGRGVFKSTDGGRTWHYLGLAATRDIGRIWIDPHNADVVVVAAMGHLYGPNHQRGIYRTTNGGKTWQHVLYINDQTGVVDLAADPSNPKLLFAAAWQMRDWPWLDYFEPHGGPGSAIYRSADGGKTWTRLSGGGWPSGPLGRIGLAVAHTARGTRVYAAVDSATQGGVWRSDDGGTHWQRVNDDESVFGNWYFARLTVDPSNPNVVFSAGQSIRRSSDGGRTWHIIKGAPGGDDYHFVWINPLHPNHWIAAADQGATVTVDGGRSWSSWYNQPTGQFYHVAADNRFPYWIYSGQQDSGSVGTETSSNYGTLTWRSWHPVGGDERDYMVPDPTDPNLVFGSGLGGRVTRWDAHTGQVANVSPYPIVSYGAAPYTVKYRYGWVTPLVFTATKPYALLLGAQVLFRSVNLGTTWKIISPDLTGKIAGTRGCTAAATGALARACGFGVISAIAPSPRSAGEIWVGTDSGLVQLTRDDGAHWRNVTPPQLKPWEKISSISPSAHQLGTAYVSVDNQRQDDFHPYILRTHDFGAHWRRIVTGLPAHQPVSVVCADPRRAGLLYAGTTEGAYVSFDDGAHWQSLQQNLPVSSVRDIKVRDNDLVLATHGRSVWIMDDITALRQMSAVHPGAVTLFKPASAIRLRPAGFTGTPLPKSEPTAANPPNGAYIDYVLPAGVKGPVTVSILSADDRIVRRYSSADYVPPPDPATLKYAPEWVPPPMIPSAAPGMHRLVWDLHYAKPAAPGAKGPEQPGVWAPPGRYTAELTVAGRTYRQPLLVKPDPRVKVSQAALMSQFHLAQKVERAEFRASQAEAAAVKLLDALDTRMKRGRVQRGVLAALYARARHLSGEQPFPAHHRGFGSPPPRNLQSLAMLSQALVRLERAVDGADAAPSPDAVRGYTILSRELNATLMKWQHLEQVDVPKANQQLTRAGAAPLAG